MRLIFHIDVNSAFLSWTALERLKTDPSLYLRTIPAIIGGDEKSRHGVVLAKSIPAKKYGIQTGEPVASALRKCPFLHMEPPSHELYRKRSREMINLLLTYTSDIEQVSIDECYMDFTPICHRFEDRLSNPALHIHHTLSEKKITDCNISSDNFSHKISVAQTAARQIADRIRNELGFTVNIGIAPNKLLAKMASDFTKPDKVHTLFHEDIPVKMWPLSVRELFMVGHSSADRLMQLGIRTIGELAQSDPVLLQQHFKSHGKTMWEYANGIDNSPLNPDNHEVKGIGNSTTLSSDAKTAEESKRVLLALADQVSSRLRKANQLAQTVTVEIKYNTFRSCSRQTQLSTPVSTSGILYDCACRLFDELWDGTPIRLLGIRTSKLVPDNTPVQLSLFDELFMSGTFSKTVNNTNHASKNISSKTGTVDKCISSTIGTVSAAQSYRSADSPEKSVRSGDLSSGSPLSASQPISHSTLEKQKRLDQAMDQIRQRYGKNAVVRGSFLKTAKETSDKNIEIS